MADTSLARATAFTHEVARRQAGAVVDLPYGFAVLHRDYPASFDNNKLVLTAPVEPAEALAAADRVLGGAGLGHRMIVTYGDAAGAPAFVAAGYEHATNVVMAHSGAAPDRPADPAVRVEPVDLDALRVPVRDTWRRELPDVGADVVEQLVGRRAAVLRAADQVLFLAVRDGTGRVTTRADLYLDPARGVAQIEDVVTDPAHRGRGHARAVLADALRRARQAGCDLVFLVADADDWPRRLYARLGYAPVGDSHVFLRRG